MWIWDSKKDDGYLYRSKEAGLPTWQAVNKLKTCEILYEILSQILKNKSYFTQH